MSQRYDELALLCAWEQFSLCITGQLLPVNEIHVGCIGHTLDDTAPPLVGPDGQPFRCLIMDYDLEEVCSSTQKH